MRQIKFRLWDKLKNKMIYPEKDTNYKIYLRGLVIEYDVWCTHEVVLMQYTGIKDKNGKEVFESDVVQWKGLPSMAAIDHEMENKILIIKWEEKPCAFRANEFTMLYSNVFEVIGNIYENPELLQDK